LTKQNRRNVQVCRTGLSSYGDTRGGL
jgi:hypothetical protein